MSPGGGGQGSDVLQGEIGGEPAPFSPPGAVVDYPPMAATLCRLEQKPQISVRALPIRCKNFPSVGEKFFLFSLIGKCLPLTFTLQDYVCCSWGLASVLLVRETIFFWSLHFSWASGCTRVIAPSPVMCDVSFSVAAFKSSCLSLSFFFFFFFLVFFRAAP